MPVRSRMRRAAGSLRRRGADARETLEAKVRRRLGMSDYSRWSRRESFEERWDERTFDLGARIRNGQSVIEFGAGRRVLESRLDPSIAYTPSDLVDRGPGTVVCDLNERPLPAFDYDVALFSGVLEYVNDVPTLAEHLHAQVGTVLASYAVRELNPPERLAHGWVNAFTEDELVAVFEAHGFAGGSFGRWENQLLFEFER